MKSFIQFIAVASILFCGNHMCAQTPVKYHEKFYDNRMQWPVVENAENEYVVVDTLEAIYIMESYSEKGVECSASFVLNAQKDFTYSYDLQGSVGYQCAIGLSNNEFKLSFEIDFNNDRGYRFGYTKNGEYKLSKWNKVKNVPESDSLEKAGLKLIHENNALMFVVNNVNIVELKEDILEGVSEFTQLNVSVVNSEIYITDLFIEGEAKLTDKQMYMLGEGISDKELAKKKVYNVKEAEDEVDPMQVYRLNIDYSWKNDFLPSNLVYCRNLQEAEISAGSGIDYTGILEQLSNYPSLQKLEIYSMEELPSALGQLTNLRSLKVLFCKEKRLPEFISNLTKLERLDLFRNDFQEYPQSLSKLQHVTFLSIADNEVKEVPRFIFELPNLDSLDLGYNDIETISEDIGQLKELEYLDLCFNNLQSLPENIGELIQLKHLKLGWNYGLTKFPKEIGNLKSLEILDMYGCDNDPCNGLDEIPAEMGNLTKLKQLDFGWCHVKTIPNELKKLENLEFFRINGQLSDAEKAKAKKMFSFVKNLDL